MGERSGVLKRIINRINVPTPQQVTEVQDAAKRKRATQQVREQVRDLVTIAAGDIGVPTEAATAAGEVAAKATSSTFSVINTGQEDGETQLMTQPATPN